MRIAVNARMLLPGRLEGNGVVIDELARRVPRLMPEHEFLLLFDRPVSRELADAFAPNAVPLACGPPARHPLLMSWYYEVSLPRVFRRLRPDVWFTADGFTSLKAGLPSLALIPDLGFLENPRFMRPAYRRYYLSHFPRFVRAATRILAETEFGREDIVRRLGYPREAIDIISLGPSLDPVPLDGPRKESVRARFSGGFPYFVFVGPVHPRKNLRTLLEAFDLFRERGFPDHRLLVVGRTRGMDASTRATLASIRARRNVLFTGWVDRKTMSLLLGTSVALCYPSFYEGCGIPIIDAMTQGVPVIASGTTGIPEVAGDGALLTDPRNAGEIAEAMGKIAGDPAIGRELIEKGLRRARGFSWDRAADIAVRNLRMIIDMNRHGR
ncbi:MAG: glycosyltransferase family 4 protein [Candidatus Aminicenantales bacterium]